MITQCDWKNKLWEDYLPWAFALGVLLALINYNYDGFYQVILLSAFFIASGFRKNLEYLREFIKKHAVFTIVCILIIIHQYMIVSGFSRSCFMVITVFSLVFAGFRLVQSGKDSLLIGQKKWCILVFFLFAIGLSWYFHGTNATIAYFPIAQTYYNMEASRFAGFFMQPMPCATTACVFLLTVSAFVRNRKVKLPLIIFGFVVLFLTVTRMTIIITLAALLFYWLFIRKITFREIKSVITENKIWSIVFLAVIVVFCIIFRVRIANYAQRIIVRFSHMSANKDWSVSYRVWVYNTVPSLVKNSGIRDLLFGHGMVKATEALRALPNPSPDGFSSPVENTYLSLLYDFGLALFLMYFAATIRTLIYLFKDKDFYRRSVYLICLSLMAISFTFDVEYWLNVSVLLFIYTGIATGLEDGVLLKKNGFLHRKRKKEPMSSNQ